MPIANTSSPKKSRQQHAREGLTPWGVSDAESHRPFWPLGPNGAVFYDRIDFVHELGDFIIVEATCEKADNAAENEPLYSTRFFPYVIVGATVCRLSHVYHSLDGALVRAIAYKHLAVNRSVSEAMNTQVGTLFFRMVGDD